MASTGYSCTTTADIALAAATAKSVLGVVSPSSFGVDFRGFQLSFNGVTASAVSVLWEICQATFATNGPGTNSTSTTVQQVHGRTITAGFTAAQNWTTEPTVLTVIESDLVTPNAGGFFFDYPLERSPDNAVSTGFVLRLTAPAVVSARSTFKFGRC